MWKTFAELLCNLRCPTGAPCTAPVLIEIQLSQNICWTPEPASRTCHIDCAIYNLLIGLIWLISLMCAQTGVWLT